MSARKRKDGEDFKAYRESLAKEDKTLKQYLRGKVIWNNGTWRKNNG